MRYPANPQPQLSPNSKQFSQSKNIKHPKTIGDQEFHSLFQYLAVQVSTFLFSMVFDIDVTSDTVFAQYQMWQQSINTTLGMSAQYPTGFILL